MSKNTVFTALATFVVAGLVFVPITAVFAEQSGGTPESGVTSRIKQVYDSLVALSYGSDSAGSWGDWGNMWNRIRSASEWTPNSGLTPEEVVSGETFYSGSRVAQTGTAPAPIDFTNQQYSTRDDYGGPNGSGAEDYQGEESVWTSPTTNVWKDTRTGLYWSSNQGTMTNSFTQMSLNTCDFFNSTPRGSYNGGDADCGTAINYCATLDFGGRTNWYLPSQKELLQAYIDGMYNKAGNNLTEAASFTTTNNYWSSSEVSYDSTYAWDVFLFYGYNGVINKANAGAVRCVSRD